MIKTPSVRSWMPRFLRPVAFRSIPYVPAAKSIFLLVPDAEEGWDVENTSTENDASDETDAPASKPAAETQTMEEPETVPVEVETPVVEEIIVEESSAMAEVIVEETTVMAEVVVEEVSSTAEVAVEEMQPAEETKPVQEGLDGSADAEEIASNAGH